MSQNIYDNPEFFSAYTQLGRSVHGLDGAAEWPLLRSFIPELAGKRVLDLGCGFGWFSRWAREQGASSVAGYDISENMLQRAAGLTSDDNITYQRADLETLELPDTSFDFAFSSLALHYILDAARLLHSIHNALVPGALLVFSTEHPIYTAPTHPEWQILPNGSRIWPLDSYLKEGSRSTDWLTKGVIKQHRTIGTLVSLLTGAGFGIRRLQEWCPTDEQIALRPELAEIRERPMFLLFAAQRE